MTEATDRPANARTLGHRRARGDGVGQPRAPRRHALPAARLLRLHAAVPVLLDGDHGIQAERGALRLRTYNPFWIAQPTLDHIRKLLFETAYPRWLWTTMTVAVGRDFLSLSSSVLAAYAIQRLRFKGSAVRRASPSFSPTWCRRRSCSFRSRPWSSSSASSIRRLALILAYPTFLMPFCTWLLMGYFSRSPTSWRNAP